MGLCIVLVLSCKLILSCPSVPRHVSMLALHQTDRREKGRDRIVARDESYSTSNRIKTKQGLYRLQAYETQNLTRY